MKSNLFIIFDSKAVTLSKSSDRDMIKNILDNTNKKKVKNRNQSSIIEKLFEKSKALKQVSDNELTQWCYENNS